MGLWKSKLFKTVLAQPRRYGTIRSIEEGSEKFKFSWVHYTVGITFMGVLGYDIWYAKDQKSKLKRNILLQSEFTECQVKEIIQVNHDSFLYKVHAKQIQQAPIPFHIVIKDDSCQVGRSYTPIYSNENEFGLLIKHYKDGLISNLLKRLQPGDPLLVRGPVETMMPYIPNSVQNLGLVAGGSGITPMYQIIKKVLDNPQDKTVISLYYCNKTEDDILLKRELDILQKANPTRLQVHYCIDKPHWGWKGFKTLELKGLEKSLPDPKSNSVVLVCGPDGFISAIAGPKTRNDEQGELSGKLKQLGFTVNQVYKL